ncbi:MAG: pentapeptide repeat-containing protein [Candidatus Aminicenantes bacterium]|nr:MAG: pentapeptide repeat-containing protein [Candidatus Aminicenantes bacterium]
MREHKKKPWISRYYEKTVPPAKKVSKVQLIIDMEMIDFTDRRKSCLISGVSSFLAIAPFLVKIISVVQGTVKVTIEIPYSKKKKLLEAGLGEEDELPKYVYPLKILEIYDPLKKERTALQKKVSGVTTYIDEIAKNPIDIKIDFDTIERINFKTSDIIQCDITGHINSNHKFSKANIIRSRLTKITARQANFNRIDFKDCFIIDSYFEGSSFEVGGMATSHLYNTTFRKCHYFDSSITDTVFDNITFEKCDLSNLMIKSCRFKECRFIECKTSNKLFEMSLVIDCKFIKTEIRNRTITDNFGLKNTDLFSSKIRVSHIKHKSRFLNRIGIEELIDKSDLTHLEKFKLSFFLNPSLVMGLNLLDSALRIRMWQKLLKNPGTFGTILELFSEFLLDLYEKNNLTVHTLLLLHSITSQLSDSDSTENKNISVTGLFKTILGVHMILARIVEEYLLVFKLLVQNVSWPVIFLVNGPLDKEFYTNTFSHIFAKSTLKISKIQRRNSPNELHITGSNYHDLSVLLGNYLASRVKDELNRIKHTLMNKSGFPANMTGISGGSQIVPYKMGIAKKDFKIPLLPTEISSKDSFFYQLVLKSIMPGRLLEELQINESTSTIRKMRSTFLLLPAIEESGESL